MKVDMYYSEPHYKSHMAPIFDALPDELRGQVFKRHVPGNSPNLTMVAGWSDVQALRGRRRMIYVEHGSGQSYGGDPSSAHFAGYSLSGGKRHRGVVGFICPNETVASRWSTAPTAVVGCPKMDQYILNPPKPADMTVCFAWHFDSGVSPEARSAWPHWAPLMQNTVRALEADGWHCYGHAHPKWRGTIDDEMSEMGLEVLMRDSDVFREASVLVVDNSSLGPEVMLLNRPVIWLNAPWYRRETYHGGRFWEWTVGVPAVDDPHDLIVELNDRVDMFGDDCWRADQRAIVEHVYAVTDGTSSQRAADFIAERASAL